MTKRYTKYHTLLPLAFLLMTSLPQTTMAQGAVDYEEMIKSSWSLTEFNGRYHREEVKGTALLFPEFALGRLITIEGERTEVLFFNFDTISKKLFTRKAERQRITHETLAYSIDSLIVFETASSNQKAYIRLLPEAFATQRPYPTIYEMLTVGKYSLIKETVMAFVKAKQAVSAYDQSHTSTDYYHPVNKYYLKNPEGKYQSIKLTKRAILSVMTEQDKEGVIKFVKQNGLKWRGETEIAQILSGFNLN